MATKKLVPKEDPRSLKFAELGIRTSADYCNIFAALVTDVIAGRIEPQRANAACNAGARLLKMVEMQHRYGTVGGQEPKEKTLALSTAE